MKIKRFKESVDSFIPIKIETPRMYYKIYVDNSIRKLDVALYKLGLKQSFYRYFDFDIKNFEKYIINNKEVFLLIDFYENSYDYEFITDVNIDIKNDDRFEGRLYGGEIYVTEEELYVKRNESYNEKEIDDGDFALFYYDDIANYAYHVKLTPKMKEFINSNIGTIICISNPENSWIEVAYDKDIDGYKPHNKILLTKDAIVAYSKDRKELEKLLAAKKYNL